MNLKNNNLEKINKKLNKINKNIGKKRLDPDYLIEWVKKYKIQIDDDWENKIKIILKKLEDLILVKKNNVYFVENHKIEIFIDLKAKINELIKKIKDFILLPKTELIVDNRFILQENSEDLSKLTESESEITNLIVNLFFEIKKKPESYLIKKIELLRVYTFQIQHEFSKILDQFETFERQKFNETMRIEAEKSEYKEEEIRKKNLEDCDGNK